jgi:hypothetical protein
MTTQIIAPNKKFSFKLNPIIPPVPAVVCPAGAPPLQYIDLSDAPILALDWTSNLGNLTATNWQTDGYRLIPLFPEANRCIMLTIDIDTWGSGDFFYISLMSDTEYQFNLVVMGSNGYSRNTDQYSVSLDLTEVNFVPHNNGTSWYLDLSNDSGFQFNVTSISALVVPVGQTVSIL